MSFLGDSDEEWNEKDSLLAAARQETAKHHAHSHGEGKRSREQEHGHSHDSSSSHGHSHAHGAAADDPELFLLNPEEESAHGHAHDGQSGGGHGHSHGGGGGGHGHAHGAEAEGWDMKVVAFWAIGILTIVYVIAELGVALYLGSLTLLSDGFHNLSDVISLYIAYWATQAAKRPLSDKMSFGWARTELLGALLNGTFLLALCLYTFLEAIPEIITAAEATSGPEGPESSGSSSQDSATNTKAFMFIGIAVGGLTVNTIGTVVFHFTGQSHGHSHAAGGHDHGGSDGGHGHSHGGAKKKAKRTPRNASATGSSGVLAPDGLQVNDRLRSTNELTGMNRTTAHDYTVQVCEEDDHMHHEPAKTKQDMNVRAVFLHYLGDMVSSALVLVAGILLYFFGHELWTGYLDAITSLLIVVLILVTTLPLVKACSVILLQATPTEIDLGSLKEEVRNISGVVNVHDLHCWQLVNDLPICSLHVAIEEGTDFNTLAVAVKELLHEYGIHSSTIQPEFVHRYSKSGDVCLQNCVEGCEEEWCCEKATPASHDH